MNNETSKDGLVNSENSNKYLRLENQNSGNQSREGLSLSNNAYDGETTPKTGLENTTLTKTEADHTEIELSIKQEPES